MKRDNDDIEDIMLKATKYLFENVFKTDVKWEACFQNMYNAYCPEVGIQDFTPQKRRKVTPWKRVSTEDSNEESSSNKRQKTNADDTSMTDAQEPLGFGIFGDVQQHSSHGTVGTDNVMLGSTALDVINSGGFSAVGY